MTEKNSDDGRKRGVISPADREYLRSDPESYSRQSQHARETAIHDRLQDSIKDFEIILRHIDRIDTAAVLGGEDTDERTDIWVGLTAMVGFLYVAARDYATPFEKLVKTGVTRAALECYGQHVTADVEIDHQETVDIPRACELVDRGEIDQLTDREREWVLEMVSEGADLTAESLLETYANTSEGRAMQEMQEKIEEYRE